jgi:predicted double-glycine peptidase
MERLPAYRSIPRGAIKIDLPNTFQIEGHTCGPSALMAIFAYYGVGPEEEWDLATLMRIDDTGSDPKHLIRAVRKYRLKCQEFQPMTTDQVVACLDRGRPVMIMLQAWARGRSFRADPRAYRNHWTDGHWIVAIGYDRERLYFEDPAIYRARGYIRRAELDLRWHDVVGTKESRSDHYGIAIWKPGVRRSVFGERARRIR